MVNVSVICYKGLPQKNPWPSCRGYVTVSRHLPTILKNANKWDHHIAWAHRAINVKPLHAALQPKYIRFFFFVHPSQFQMIDCCEENCETRPFRFFSVCVCEGERAGESRSWEGLEINPGSLSLLTATRRSEWVGARGRAQGHKPQNEQ